MIKTKIRCATKIFKNQKVFLLKTIIVQVKRILLFGLGERHVAGNPKQKKKREVMLLITFQKMKTFGFLQQCKWLIMSCL